MIGIGFLLRIYHNYNFIMILYANAISGKRSNAPSDRSTFFQPCKEFLISILLTRERQSMVANEVASSKLFLVMARIQVTFSSDGYPPTTAGMTVHEWLLALPMTAGALPIGPGQTVSNVVAFL